MVFKWKRTFIPYSVYLIKKINKFFILFLDFYVHCSKLQNPFNILIDSFDASQMSTWISEKLFLILSECDFIGTTNVILTTDVTNLYKNNFYFYFGAIKTIQIYQHKIFDGIVDARGDTLHLQFTNNTFKIRSKSFRKVFETVRTLRPRIFRSIGNQLQDSRR